MLRRTTDTSITAPAKFGVEAQPGSCGTRKGRSWHSLHIKLVVLGALAGWFFLTWAWLWLSPVQTGTPPLDPTFTAGRGGAGVATAPGQFCGSLAAVLAHFGFSASETNGVLYLGNPPDYTTPGNPPVPTDPNSLLSHIPAPAGGQQGVSYDQRTQQVCASEANGKAALLAVLQGQTLDPQTGLAPQATQPTPQPQTNTGSTGDGGFKLPDIKLPDIKLPDISLDPGKWIWDGITGFWDKLWKQIVDFFQHQIIDWASSLGFMYITPAVLSYKNPIVLAGVLGSLGALDGFVALLLVVGGYQYALNRYLDLEAGSLLGAALRVALAAVVANIGFFVLLPNIIELSNTMSMGMLGVLIRASAGDVTLPLGAINWVEQPISWAVFIILDFIGALLLILVDAVRLAVLDVCIVFSPWWIMALANEYTRAWGRLGATTFFCALFMQPIQDVTLGLGSALIANWGHLNPNDPAVCQQLPPTAQATCLAQLGHASISSQTPVTLFLGLATIYVACKMPGMLFSNAVRASIGAVNRDVGRVVKAAMGYMMFMKTMNK
jgi:hypothetical protein